MNEEIEYAEMLEIPVSTVNVVRKKSRRKKTAEPVPQTAQPTQQSAQQAMQTGIEPTPAPTTTGEQSNPLKEDVLKEVNGRIHENAAATGEETQEGRLIFDPDPTPERVDTVRLYSSEDLQGCDLDEQAFVFGENEKKDGGRCETNAEPKGVRIALGIEFAAACALCGAIFLTNVFMPNSAINTFFRAIGSSSAETTDARTYAEFTLSPVVSDLSDAELTLSADGVLSFQDECCVYPAADGTVSELKQLEDGTFVLKIQHSDSFTGIIHGLDRAYYQVGDKVKANVPVGFTEGETPVQVTMYSQGELLNCFELTEENCLAWIPAEE